MDDPASRIPAQLVSGGALAEKEALQYWTRYGMEKDGGAGWGLC